MVARRWKDLGIDGRTTWKERATQTSEDRETRAKTGTNNDENQIDKVASRTNYSYLPSKDIDDKDVSGAGTGTASNAYSEGNGEEEDEDISGDLAED